MSGQKKEGIVFVSDGRPGGVTEIHTREEASEPYKEKARAQGMLVSNYDVKKKRHSKGKAK